MSTLWSTAIGQLETCSHTTKSWQSTLVLRPWDSRWHEHIMKYSHRTIRNLFTIRQNLGNLPLSYDPEIPDEMSALWSTAIRQFETCSHMTKSWQSTLVLRPWDSRWDERIMKYSHRTIWNLFTYDKILAILPLSYDPEMRKRHRTLIYINWTLRKIFAKKRQSIIRTAHEQIIFYLKIIFLINICKSNYVLMVKDNLQWHIEIMHTCYKLQEINTWISYNLCNRIPVTPLLKQLHLESDILLKTIGAHWVGTKACY